MNDGALLSKWDKLMRVVEVPYAAAVANEKDRYIETCSAEFEHNRSLTETSFHEHVAFMMRIAEKYQGIAIRLAIQETFSAKSARVMLTKDDWETLWLYLVRQWVNTYGASWAKIASMTTRRDLQSIIDVALSHTEEFNPVQVATKLLKAKDLSAPRAEVIARTEVHGAMMFAGLEGANKISRDQGLDMRKRWVPVEDERTRISHASMASVDPIDLQSDFDVGGEAMARPGDPRGSAGNVINCRCVLAYEVK